MVSGYKILGRLSYVLTPPLNSQVMHETDLAVCAIYKDGTSTSTELHRVYETHAQSHDPKRMLSGQHYLEFHYLDLSHPYVVKLQTQIYFTGRIFFSLKFVSDL